MSCSAVIAKYMVQYGDEQSNLMNDIEREAFRKAKDVVVAEVSEDQQFTTWYQRISSSPPMIL
jgi:TRAP-type C4-dicarboxylate transport system substrate-binding protein